MEVAAGAGDRAAGARPHDDVRDPAVGVVPDLRPGGPVVRFGPGLVGELVGLERAGPFGGDAIGHPVVGLGGVGGDVGLGDDDLGAVGREHVPLALAHLIGGDEHGVVTADRRDHRQAHPGVAGGRLHDRAAGGELAGALGVGDEADGDPILDRAAGIHVLELRQDGRPDPGGHGVELDEGGAADEVEHGVCVLHWDPDAGDGVRVRPRRWPAGGSGRASRPARGRARARPATVSILSQAAERSHTSRAPRPGPSGAEVHAGTGASSLPGVPGGLVTAGAATAVRAW